MSNCICPIAFYGLTVHPSNIITSCMLTENKLASVKESNGIDNDNFVKLRENMALICKNDWIWFSYSCVLSKKTRLQISKS